MHPVLFKSGSTEWETPRDLFDRLDDEFGFTLDVCANSQNKKCVKCHSRAIDGLRVPWSGETCFMNPPYGREIGKWVKKAYEESRNCTTKVVCLLPARTDTRWFHDYIYGKAEIRFLKGRLKFGSAKYNAPLPSMIVIFSD